MEPTKPPIRVLIADDHAMVRRGMRDFLGRALLTARERDVLAAVARGLSNRSIADELGITERTARTHVSNILAKLGLASRTQAALLAAGQGPDRQGPGQR